MIRARTTGTLFLSGALLLQGLVGCATPAAAPAQLAADPQTLTVATRRVEQAIDAANACVANYMRRYDLPSITPSDVLDAALSECRPYFSAHRGALLALTALTLASAAGDASGIEAEAEADRHADNFQRIVRETGLYVLVQRRATSSPLRSLPSDDGERFL